MKRSVLAPLLLAATLLLGGCGLGGDKDDTAGWSAQKLYGEAKDAMNARSWDKAIKYLEKLEARYPYGRFDATHQQMARQAGYATATTTHRGRTHAGDDAFTLRRIMVARATHLGLFAAKIMTGYEDRRACPKGSSSRT